MLITTPIVLLTLACMALSSYQCWRLGKSQGIGGTLDNLKASGLLDWQEE